MNSPELPDPALPKQVILDDLGLTDYREAWDYQEKHFAEIVNLKIANRKTGSGPLPVSRLIVCEHPHVYTLGKSGKMENLLLNAEELSNVGATFYKINRGGDITYHGPGQLVVYPLLDLDQFFTDIHKYLRLLEEAVMLTLAEYGIAAGRIEGLTGVWLDGEDPSKARKICAMGVKCSRWVTMHGLAFNINTDLSYFQNIIPCGIDDKAVTSLQHEIGQPVALHEVSQKLLAHLQGLFGWHWA